MKKLLSLILILAFFGIAIAAELQPIAFPFIGKWNPSEDPTLLDDYGLQDVQNLRKSGKHFKGIGGHTIINSTSISSYPYFLNGFHFRKDQPSESHVIVLAANSTTPTASYLYQNTTAIPSAGLFSATTLHTEASGGMGSGRFSNAPNGNMVYANGVETLIWSGAEIEPVAFITSANSLTGTSSSLTNPYDYSEAVRNTRTTADQVAVIGGGIDVYTVLMLHMDGIDASTTFTDSSPTTPHTVTAVGNAQIDTAQFKFATASGLFDGTSDYLTIPDDPDFDLSGGIWTIDFWVRLTANVTQVIYYQETDANNYIKISTYNGGSYPFIKFGIQAGGVEIVGFNTNPESTILNQWVHIAYVENGNNYYLFINGALRNSITDTDRPANYTGLVYIGGLLAGNSITGSLDEFRVSKGIARWTATFTPPAKAYRTDSLFWLVGFYRPLQGVKLYVSEVNVSASTTTVQEWNGASWTDLTVTDNTDTGPSLAQTGTVTWSSTVNTSKPKYINGLSLYWYQFALSAGSATIYYATVDAPLQSIKNIWDGAEVFPAKCLKYDSTTYIDYSSNVIDDLMTTFADLSSLGTTHYVVIGFATPQQALNIKMVTASENSTASTQMTLSYWNGGAWAAVTAKNDGTATSTISLSKTGVVSFQGSEAGTEFTKTISDEVPLYYYKLNFASTLGANCKIGEIRGIPAPQPLATYTFSHEFQNRLFLFNEYNGEKNKGIYSVANAPDIFNGSNSGSLYFGDKTGIVAAAFVYNVFKAGAYDQLIVTKKNETYRVSGDGPTNWVVQRISANIGCVAPLSMVACEVSEGAEVDVKKQVAIWQSDKGFVMTDGAAVIPISDDINCYFDPNDSRYIPTIRQTKTVAWYDPSTRSYKALISSGSTATYHNIELEYSLISREWTKIYRVDASGADPLQCGFQVWDTNGLGYTYGGNTKGFLYRLENGSTFAGTAIPQILHTKDLILDIQVPLFRKSTVKFARVALKKKAAGGTVTMAHYGDQVLTVSGSTNQFVPSVFSIATSPYNTQSCNMGPFLYHSFKFTSSQSTVDGMELTGLGVYSEPYTLMR